jgi:predicted  nucleic acid-binding Zn-ribbon protein
MRIIGWKSEGLRCPDHELSFADGDAGAVFPITLIQMPNGTGKTTTLQLLRAALSGEAESGGWNAAKVKGFRKSGGAAAKGTFRVVLLCTSGRVTIIMEFDFVQWTVRYKTTAGSGVKEGFHPPRDVQRFLRPEFVGCFVFDGELAERLLSHDYTNAETIMENLFQLSLFGSAAEAVKEYWERVTANNGAKEEKGYTRRRNKVDNLTERLRQLRAEQSAAQRALASVESELAAMRGQFSEKLARQHKISQRLLTAETDRAAARAALMATVAGTFAAMHSPHSLCSDFAADMLGLRANLDKVKLPEHSAREFFVELAEESMCVCGRDLDEDTRAAIRTRAGRYLGSDEVSLLNALKSDISAQIGTDPEAHRSDLDRLVEQLDEQCRLDMEAKTRCDEIRVLGVSNDPALADADRRIADRESRRDKFKEQLNRYRDTTESANDDETFGIKVLEKRLKESEQRLAEVTNTITLKAKRDVLLALLAEAHRSARTGIGAEITAQTNERIGQLMPHNRIRVNAVNKCLVLEGQDGGSVGETLSVAYAFLSTLFNRSEHLLPFIVDSPANPIDLKVRGKVAQLIPKLNKQFIAFTISSEREGFLAPLEQAAPGKIQYLTLFRRGAAPSLPGESVESSDAVCVRGREYFHQFHLNDEVSGGV